MLTDFFDSQNIGIRGKFRPFIPMQQYHQQLLRQFSLLPTFSSPIKTAIATGLFMLFDCFTKSNELFIWRHMIPAITKIQMNAHNWQLSGRRGNNRLLICTVAFIPLQSLFLYNYHWLWLCSLNFSSSLVSFFIMLCYKGTKEHYIRTPIAEYKASIIKSFCAIFHNPPLLPYALQFVYTSSI